MQPIAINVGNEIEKKLGGMPEVSKDDTPQEDTRKADQDKVRQKRFVAIRSDGVGEGKLTMSAVRRQSGTLITGPTAEESRQADGAKSVFVRRARAYHWMLNPFKLRAGKIEGRGSVVPTAKVRIRCTNPSCEYTAVAYLHEIAGMRKNNNTACPLCRQRTGTESKLQWKRIALRLLPDLDNEHIAGAFNAVDAPVLNEIANVWAQHEFSNVSNILPRMWAVYDSDKAPTDVKGWREGDVKADMIEQRLVEKCGCTIRPVSIARKADTGAIKTVLMELGAGWQMGWVYDDELYETEAYGFKRRFLESQDQRKRRRQARHNVAIERFEV